MSSVDGSGDGGGNARARASARRGSIPAHSLPFSREPPGERSDGCAGAEVGGQDDPEHRDDQKRRAGSGATEHAFHAGADPATQRARLGGPDHPDQAEERHHGDGAPERGKRARPPLGGHAQTRAGQHEPCHADPGADPKGSEEPVVHRSGDRPAAGQDEHSGEDHARADGADPVSSRRRSRWSSGGREPLEARERERGAGRRDGVRLRVGRVGAERAMS